MKHWVTIAVAAAMGFAGPARAASDGGLMLHDGPMAMRSSASGAGIALKVRWDTVRRPNAQRLSAFELRAGPVLSIRDATAADGLRRGVAPVAALAFGPRGQTSFRIAGREVGEGARTHAGEDKDDKQSTGDKLAWVAAVAGGVMLVLVGTAVAYCASSRCSD